jgi:hypothetical protein
VNDLYLVVFGDGGARPVRAAYDFLIALYGQTVGREREIIYQGFQRYPVGQFPLLAVHSYTQSLLSHSSALMDYAPQLRLVAVRDGAHEYGRASGLKVREDCAHLRQAIVARAGRKD